MDSQRLAILFKCSMDFFLVAEDAGFYAEEGLFAIVSELFQAFTKGANSKAYLPSS